MKANGRHPGAMIPARLRDEGGQALVMVIGIALAIAVAAGFLVSYGQALGSRGRSVYAPAPGRAREFRAFALGTVASCGASFVGRPVFAGGYGAAATPPASQHADEMHRVWHQGRADIAPDVRPTAVFGRRAAVRRLQPADSA